MRFMSAQRVSRVPSVRKVVLLAASVALCLMLGPGGAGGQTADDHGDTFATATPLSLGSSISGHIRDGDDWDVFKIDLSSASGTTDVWAYTTGNDEDTDTVGGLYDSESTLLAFNDDGFMRGGRKNFSLRRNVPPGVYYVVVVSYKGEPTDYILHAEAVTDPGSSTDTAAHLGIDSPAGGTIDDAEDADYFRLDFTESTHLIIEAINVNLTPISADLLDAEGNEVSANIYRLFLSRLWSGFRLLDDFGPGTYYVRVTAPAGIGPRPVPYAILAIEDTDYADFIEECEASTRSLNDPQIGDSLYGCQWHLDSSNERDINVEPVWADGNMGEGVNVAVVDDGMDYRHEDLKDNINTDLNFDYTGGGDIYQTFEHHGTHVAGIIAARDNDVGVRGVAPRATVYGYNLLAELEAFTFSNEADAMTRNGVATAVSNNSWGSIDGPWLGRASSFWELAVNTGITTGYDGKGTFYVFSAGNGHLLGDDSNLDEYVNYYGVTAVCSVDSRDGRAGYSEMGANLWVCGPANDRPGVLGGIFGILTTEHSDRYERDFAGTSAAAPIVSGVAALVRSANPDLTWRDLKLVLAASARKNDPGSSGWEDGASKYGDDSATDRYHFNHEYGFGVVDAGAAVALAKEWSNIPPLESSTAVSSQPGLQVPDAPDAGDPETVTSTLALDTGIGFTEFVEVTVAFRHGSFRDLEIELVSPSGAVSKLAVPYDTYADINFNSFVPMYGAFRLGSAKHLGEDPNGEWQLRVTDHFHVASGILDAWRITVYGHDRTPDAPTVDSVAGGQDSIAVAWTAPVQTAGSAVTAYDLRYTQADADGTVDSGWTVVNDAWTADAGGNLEHTIIGLTQGTRYDIQVRAINAWGAGDWSVVVSGAPENVSPSFDEGAATDRSVTENAPPGSYVGNPVVATDDDDDTLTYSLDGADADSFGIDGGTGQIEVGPGTALDYETRTSYTVAVTATDPSGGSDTITVNIMVTDVDLGTPYDLDHNEVIDRDEVIAAIADYFDGLIDKEEVLEVIQLYFSSAG